jgi:DNA-binding MarR family transcriptional regulator
MGYYSLDNFFPDTSVGYLIRICQQHSYAVLDALCAEEGITGVQWSALIGIHTGRGDTCAALARDMAHDKGAMTRMIDALEVKGLVVRARISEDRRLVTLSITQKGYQVAQRCRARVLAKWNEWFEGWSADEVETLIAQLQRLRGTMEASACAV